METKIFQPDVELMKNTVAPWHQSLENPAKAQEMTLEGLLKNADIIIYGLYAVLTSEGEAGSADPLLELVDKLAEYGKPLVVVLCGAPYVAEQIYDKVDGIACSFGLGPQTLEAVVELMAGKIPAHAKLPVHVSKRLPRGFSFPVASA